MMYGIFASIFILASVLTYTYYSVYIAQKELSALAKDSSTRFNTVDASLKKVDANISRTRVEIDTTHKTQRDADILATAALAAKELKASASNIDATHAALMDGMKADYTKKFNAADARFLKDEADLTNAIASADARFKSLESRVDKNEVEDLNNMNAFNAYKTSNTAIIGDLSSRVTSNFATLDKAYKSVESNLTTFTTKTFPSSQSQLKTEIMKSQQDALATIQSQLDTAQLDQKNYNAALNLRINQKFADIDAINGKQDAIDLTLKNISKTLGINIQDVANLSQQQLADTASQLEAHIVELQTQLDTYKESFNTLSQKLAQSMGNETATLDNMQTTLNGWGTAITTIQGQIASATTDLANFKTAQDQLHTVLNTQVQSLGTTVNDFTLQVTTQKTSIDTLSDQLQEQATSMKKQLEELQTQLKDMFVVSDPLTLEKVTNLQLIALSTKLDNYENTMSQSQIAQDGLIQSLTDTVSALKASEKSLSILTTGQISGLQTQVNNLQSSLKTKLDNFEVVIAAQNTQLQGFQQQLGSISQQVDSFGTTTTDILANLKAIETNLVSMTTRLDNMDDLVARVDALTTQISAMNDYSNGGTMSGPLDVQGDLTTKQLCLGTTCINEASLKNMIGNLPACKGYWENNLFKYGINVASIKRTAVGTYLIIFATPLENDNYVVLMSSSGEGKASAMTYNIGDTRAGAKTNRQVGVRFESYAGGAVDPANFSFAIFYS